MTAKEYLKQYLDIEKSIRQKQAEIRHYESVAVSVAQTCSGVGGNPNGASDKVGQTVAIVLDLKNDIVAEVKRLADKQREIESNIEKINDSRLEIVLKYKYINGATFEQIADQMGYSRMHICRLHGKALKKLQNVIECYI